MTRSYEQRLRAESAADTRRRILDSVYARVRETPAEPVSVELVARMAGVSRSTVYVIFGSRSGLFDAFAADFLEHAGVDRLGIAVSHPDALQRLRGGLRASCEMYAADRDVARALWSMARLDQDAVGGAIQRREERRRRGMEELADGLAEQGLLRPDVSREEAAQMLWVLTSFESFDLLHHDRDLPVEVATRLLVTMAERAVLADPV